MSEAPWLILLALIGSGMCGWCAVWVLGRLGAWVGRRRGWTKPSCTLCRIPFSDWFVWEGDRHCAPCWQRSHFTLVSTEHGGVRFVDVAKGQAHG
jgi:hypothetical protein